MRTATKGSQRGWKNQDQNYRQDVQSRSKTIGDAAEKEKTTERPCGTRSPTVCLFEWLSHQATTTVCQSSHGGMPQHTSGEHHLGQSPKFDWLSSPIWIVLMLWCCIFIESFANALVSLSLSLSLPPTPTDDTPASSSFCTRITITTRHNKDATSKNNSARTVLTLIHAVPDKGNRNGQKDEAVNLRHGVRVGNRHDRHGCAGKQNRCVHPCQECPLVGKEDLWFDLDGHTTLPHQCPDFTVWPAVRHGSLGGRNVRPEQPIPETSSRSWLTTSTAKQIRESWLCIYMCVWMGGVCPYVCVCVCLCLYAWMFACVRVHEKTTGAKCESMHTEATKRPL